MSMASIARDRRVRSEGLDDGVRILHRVLAELAQEAESGQIDPANASMVRLWLHRVEHRLAMEAVRLAREATKIEGLPS